MDFKNAVKALQIGKKEGKKFRLSTEFGKNPEEELPFPEYPRPQMRRENWTNLNGWWEYAVILGFRQEKLVAILVMLGSATTVSSFIMAKNMGHEGSLTANTVMLTTCGSAFTLTFWLYLMKTLAFI